MKTCAHSRFWCAVGAALGFALTGGDTQAQAPARARVIEAGLVVAADGRVACTGKAPCPVPHNALAVNLAPRAVIARAGSDLLYMTRSLTLALPATATSVRLLGAASDRGLACLVDQANAVWCLTQHPDTVAGERSTWCQATPGGSFSVADAQHTWCRLQLPSTPVIALSGDADFGCLAGGTPTHVRCWSATSPGAVDTRRAHVLPGTLALVVGNRHVCALNDAGAARCWGDPSKGQLGVMGQAAKDDAEASPPVAIPPKHGLNLPGPVQQLFAMADLSCALLVNKQIYCWGDTEQLLLSDLRPGNWHARMHQGEAQFTKPLGASTVAALPLWFAQGCDAQSVSVDNSQVCAVCGADCVRCWGEHSNERSAACPAP